jgi:hypothetical protein
MDRYFVMTDPWCNATIAGGPLMLLMVQVVEETVKEVTGELLPEGSEWWPA